MAPKRTPKPAATPASTSTPTPRPAPTATHSPVPTATSVPAPVGLSGDASSLEGLWAGPIVSPGVDEFIPWVAFRLTPGKDPAQDQWRIESGPFPLVPTFLCSGTRRDDGWELGNCAGLRRQPQGTKLTAFLPSKGEGGLEFEYERGGSFSLHMTGTLSRVPERDEPESSPNVALAWHEPKLGIYTDIWAADGLVFAPRFDGRIEILDAKSGRLLGRAIVPRAEGAPPDRRVFDVKALGGLLYAATSAQGLVVFDVSIPSEPRPIGQYRVFIEELSPDNFVDIHNIFLSPDGGQVYAINNVLPLAEWPPSEFHSEMRIIDVSDPTTPVEAGRFTLNSEVAMAHDVNVIDHAGRRVAFLNYLEAGLWVLDVTDPASIAVLGSIEWDGIFSHSGWPFALEDRLYLAHGDEGYDQHLTVLDVTDLANPRVVSRFKTREGLSIHNVEVVDGIAYISYYVDGLRVVDLRDPENPREIGHFDTVPAEDERDILQGAWGVRVLDGMVYISDMETGTYAFEVEVE